VADHVGTGLAPCFGIERQHSGKRRSLASIELGYGDIMSKDIQVIQDWTECEVSLKNGEQRHVRYKVYKSGTHQYQEIRDVDDSPIHTLELPQDMALERSSYEVLLRYVLVDVVNS